MSCYKFDMFCFEMQVVANQTDQGLLCRHLKIVIRKIKYQYICLKCNLIFGMPAPLAPLVGHRTVNPGSLVRASPGAAKFLRDSLISDIASEDHLTLTSDSTDFV